MTTIDPPTATSRASPRYWGALAAIGVAHSIAWLPLKLQPVLGRAIGRLMCSSKKLSRIARTNISRCFPDLTGEQQDVLLRKYFSNQGTDLLEILMIWCRNGHRIVDGHVEVEGLDFMREALEQNKGIILLASHLGNADMGAMLMSYIGKQHGMYEFSGTYREQADPILDRFMARGRAQYFRQLIPVSDTRRIAQELKKKGIVWYAPDVNVDRKNAIFLPFMGIQASTTTAVSRLAKLTDSIVVPYSHHRASNGRDYKVKIFPPLAGFPSADVVADTLRINGFIEKLVIERPENYWWVLRRFKTRPVGEQPFY